MFGYVRLPQSLSEEEQQRFRSVYCGLCRTLGREYGLPAKMILNFDFTLLAILLSPPEEPCCDTCRCLLRHCKKEASMTQTQALELAAGESVILMWWQLQDGILDHGWGKRIPYRLAQLGLRRAYRKAKQRYPLFDQLTQTKLEELRCLEKQNAPSLDAPADTFAQILQAAAEYLSEERQRRIVRQILYHLGRWVYLVDAADDLEKDVRQNQYNPLRFRFSPVDGKLSEQEQETLAETLDASIGMIGTAYALTNYGVWSTLLDSIFYQGLYQVGGAVLHGTFHKRRKIQRKK